ncbi:MAG TPA: TetR/AcrR family transcriptional regulator [Methanoregula sp.]|nr:TetR/AcrR family transcriptional regulator [Methanoregula sp.]
MPRILTEYRDEVSKKIVSEAYTLFLQKGYHGTTMGEIAERLNVTKPALYQYFPGKEDLYAAVAEHGRDQLAGILERSYERGDLLDGSAALFDSLVNYVPQFNGMYSELMLLAVHNARIRELLVRDRKEDLRVIERFINGQQRRGLVSGSLDPRSLALACDALINGLLMDIMMGLDKEEAKKTWLAAVAQLIRTD